MRLCQVEVPCEQRLLIRGMWFSKASIRREKVVSYRRKRRRRSLSINNKTPDYRSILLHHLKEITKIGSDFGINSQ